MLHDALSASYTSRFNDIKSALHNGVDAMDFYTEPQLGTALACVAADMGIPDGERDIALCAALTRTNLASDKDVLNLFPIAAAALFVSEKWEKSHYLPRLEAFENNEHCIQFALAKLFSCFFTLYSSTLGQDPKDIPDNISIPDSETDADAPVEVKKVATRLATRDKYKQYVERYLRVSAQTLLVQRDGEVSKRAASQSPHRSMSLMLDYFTGLCPVVEPGTLEKYLPNYLVRADRLDVYLGKQKAADGLRPFAHAAAATQGEVPEQF